MDLLKDKISPIYTKYFWAAFGSAFAGSVYTLVDTAMVGQYHGPMGTAALAVVAPIYNVIFSMGLLVGIGASIIFSYTKGEGKDPNRHFTSGIIFSLICSAILAVIMWGFEDEYLIFFGANEELLVLSKVYLKPIKCMAYFFLINQVVAAFLRNDGDPGRASFAVLFSNGLNIILDYVMIFTWDMGIYGAGLATSISGVIQFLILCTHFLTKKNSLRLELPESAKALFKDIKDTFVNGFSAFFIDIAMGIVTILFNRQIMTYLGTDALAVYGVIIMVSTFVQACGYSVGQAAQPLLSVNFGAGKMDRVKSIFKRAMVSVAIISIIWTALSLICPELFVKLFMDATPSVMEIGPFIVRAYGISFILLVFNVFSTYYFQSILKPTVALIISLSRGLVVSGAAILILPALLGGNALWFAMTIAELVTSIYVVYKIKKSK
ncbi:MAG: multidrug transporter MatE [Clostridia bacterium]|nr:multidrug transporter MatE [Clostridia bacterium]